jgi:hypothetical protein
MLIPPTGKHSRPCLASTCHWYLPSLFFSGNRWPDVAGTTGDEQLSDGSSLSSQTTTSSDSKIAPRQQPVACWLWTRLFISGLLVLFGSYLYLNYLLPLIVWCTDGTCVLCVIFVSCSIKRCYINFISIFCVVDGYAVICNSVFHPCILCTMRVCWEVHRKVKHTGLGPIVSPMEFSCVRAWPLHGTSRSLVVTSYATLLMACAF